MDSELRKVDLMAMTDLEKRQRSAAIEEAKSWLGTPFHHMARVKGRKGGVDCGQFLLGVFGPVGVIPPFEPEPYVQQFALHNSREWYLEYLSKLATEIPEEQALEGDVVIYKVGRCFSHAAILIEPWPGKVIHAINGLGVTITHGTRQGYIGRYKQRKFFTCWPKA